VHPLDNLVASAAVGIGQRQSAVTTASTVVIAGLEVLQSLRDADQVTERPLAVTVFTNEEGVRFQPDMMGSLVYSGGLTLEEALNAKATDGARVGDELERIGYAGTERCGEPVPHAFIELHIEQGPILDMERGLLGAV